MNKLYLGIAACVAGLAVHTTGTIVSQRAAATPQYRGYDVIGLAKYCNRFLKAPPLPAFSTLVQTFGNPYPCIRKRLDRGDIKVVQIDLIDATCHRNKVCAKGIPEPTNLSAIRKRATKARKLALDYPNVQIHLSPGLEHDVRNVRTVRAMCTAVAQGCPECLCVNSPFTGAKPKGLPVESHNPTDDTFSVSTDGISIFDINTERYNTKGKATNYMWFPEMNLRYTGRERVYNAEEANM